MERKKKKREERTRKKGKEAGKQKENKTKEGEAYSTELMLVLKLNYTSEDLTLFHSLCLTHRLRNSMKRNSHLTISKAKPSVPFQCL